VKLTTQLLTFSKGGGPVKRTISLAPVIETSARFALSGSRSYCRFDVGDGLWTVEADDGQIGQVIQNIVLNADQAMPGGGVVTISARNADLRNAPAASVPGPGRWVQIVVQDTGVGIPGEQVPRIFEPYYTTKQTGSGLGLATSYSIVKNHGGLIEVSSIENRGSIFTVWLPAGESVVRPSDRVETPAVLRRGRVLIMDDDEVVRDSVGEMLASLGQEVEFSVDGASAIEKYRAAKKAGSPFSVVILDATIRGGMGGEEAVGLLRKIDPGVVAVISSGYSDEGVMADYASRGFSAFLPKPFSFESLQTVLGALMK
jgi:CheY-like chemotaxis protein